MCKLSQTYLNNIVLKLLELTNEIDIYIYILCLVKVISETLRLGNVVRFLHRKALKDVRYRGRTSHIKLVFSMNDCRNLTRFEFFFLF